MIRCAQAGMKAGATHGRGLVFGALGSDWISVLQKQCFGLVKEDICSLPQKVLWLTIRKQVMHRPLNLELNICEVRERVLQDVRRCEQTGTPWCPSTEGGSQQLEFLIFTYVAFFKAFGIGPYPDMLPHLGWPGQVLHELFCKTAGMWEAFRRLVEWSGVDLPWQTSLAEGNVVLHSVPERFVYRELVRMSGVTRVEPHPTIPGCSGRKKADFLVCAATGLSAYVEVAMVPLHGDGERPFFAGYRQNLLQKMELCTQHGFDPLVIWGDQVAAPRVLAERLNDLRARLNLPTRPPAPLAWYEEIV